jgi:hypothetical protein
MITKAVQSSKFGDTSHPNGYQIRITRLRDLEAIGAVLKDGVQDLAGNIHFEIPDDKLDEFNSIVEGFKDDIRFCW